MNEETERVKYIMHYWSKIQLARDFEELEKENQKLVKVIDELEKYIKNKDYWVSELGYKEYTPYIKVQMILNKLIELKGGSDESA